MEHLQGMELAIEKQAIARTVQEIIEHLKVYGFEGKQDVDYFIGLIEGYKSEKGITINDTTI